MTVNRVERTLYWPLESDRGVSPFPQNRARGLGPRFGRVCEQRYTHLSASSPQGSLEAFPGEHSAMVAAGKPLMEG